MFGERENKERERRAYEYKECVCVSQSLGFIFYICILKEVQQKVSNKINLIQFLLQWEKKKKIVNKEIPISTIFNVIFNFHIPLKLKKNVFNKLVCWLCIVQTKFWHLYKFILDAKYIFRFCHCNVITIPDSKGCLVWIQRKTQLLHVTSTWQ